jgi:CSLREA domain-containing protein
MSRALRLLLVAAAPAIVCAAVAPAAASAATINVTTTSDTVANDMQCSLREAVNTANSNTLTNAQGCTKGDATAPDTIVLGAGNYALGGASGDDSNASGDVDVSDSSTGGLTIQGLSPAQTTITAVAGDRALHLLGGTLVLQNLTVTGGTPPGGDGTGDGGAMKVNASAANSLSLQATTVNGGHATGNGGGIYAGTAATLSLAASTVSGSTAAGSNGGGGIEALGALTLTGSSVDANQATAALGTAAGGGIYAGPGAAVTASITDSTVSGNSSLHSDGGGIYRSNGNLSLANSTVSGNHANEGGGGGVFFDNFGSPANTLLLSGSSINGNTALDSGGGVAVQDAPASVSLSSSSLTGNGLTAPASADTLEGAGLFSRSHSNTIADTTVSGNTMTPNGSNDLGEGAGIMLFDNAGAASNLIRNSAIGGNGAPAASFNVFGAGLWNENNVGSSTTKIVNSTFSGNQATTGGGIWNQAGSVQLVQDTLGGDTASPTGQEVFVNGPGPTLSSHASIIDSTTSACAGGTPVTSLDYNLERGSGCVGLNQANDLHNTDPQLGAFSMNGGSSPTMALPSTSPAIDRVPAASCTDENGSLLTVDQRGQPRPAGAACDVGAYEFQPPAPEIPLSPPTSSGTNRKCYGKKVTILGTGTSEVLVGTAGNDVIAGMGGADKINAGGGNDIVCGGPGNDRIKGGGGNDILLGQRGRDTLIGGRGNDLLNAGVGKRETCNGGGGEDIAKGCESKKHVP